MNMRIEVKCPKCNHVQMLSPWARRMVCTNCRETTSFEHIAEWREWSRQQRIKTANVEKPK